MIAQYRYEGNNSFYQWRVDAAEDGETETLGIDLDVDLAVVLGRRLAGGLGRGLGLRLRGLGL